MDKLIGYFTDNEVSQTVMGAFRDSGLEIRHIRDFYANKGKQSIFYGILRGSGIAMRWCKAQGIDYWYVDNGYFDAVYMDEKKQKEMTGKYRIVKNEMIEPYPGKPTTTITSSCLNVLVLPPSPYTAFMYDTTPEDWLVHWKGKIWEAGHNARLRGKDERIPLEKQLKEFDAVLAFNSMAVIRAAEMGKGIYTTHGVIRNDEMFGKIVPYYNPDDLRQFYTTKNFTLDEIREQGLKSCLGL